MSAETPLFKKRSLSHEEFYKLTTWLSTQAERIGRERPTKVSLARQAGEALGHAVSEDTIGKALTCAGVVYEPRVPVGGAAHKKLRARVDELNEQIDQLKTGKLDQELAIHRLSKDINGLRALVAHLYTQLNIHPTPGDAKVLNLPVHLLAPGGTTPKEDNPCR